MKQRKIMKIKIWKITQLKHSYIGPANQKSPKKNSERVITRNTQVNIKEIDRKKILASKKKMLENIDEKNDKSKNKKNKIKPEIFSNFRYISSSLKKLFDDFKSIYVIRKRWGKGNDKKMIFHNLDMDNIVHFLNLYVISSPSLSIKQRIATILYMYFICFHCHVICGLS